MRSAVLEEKGNQMAHEGLHEAAELLDEATIDRHRAFTSLIEELEAIDWYDQRVHATRDPGRPEGQGQGVPGRLPP